MTFHFQCPQGHLLEGDESQAGQQCTCPMCGMLFIIPAPLPPAPEPEVPMIAGGPVGAHAGGPGPVVVEPAAPAEPKLLHIPCPNGHELEVPPDMLGQDVLCPHCQAQFHLREKDSVEYKKRKAEEQERRDYKRGQAWLNWAIITAVIVVIGLIVMIVASRSS